MWPKWKRRLFSILTFGVLIGFALGMKWHHRFSGSIWWWPGAIVIGIPVYILDVVWVNWILGTIFWWDLPQEPTYTMRLKRMKAAGSAEAFDQCLTLNRYDPDHC